jgi:hypothetical protein
MTAREIDKMICDWPVENNIQLTELALNILVDTLYFKINGTIPTNEELI